MIAADGSDAAVPHIVAFERQPFQRWRQYWSGMPSSTVANFIKSLWITARTSRTRRGNKA